MENLFQFLKKLYPNDAERLQNELIKFANSVEKIEPVYSNQDWYKFVNLYVIYPDAVKRKGKAPLEGILDHLDYVKQLGCNAVHILPFMESPMIDKGFDISDFYRPKKEYGNITHMRQISKRARELGLRVFIDLVFNHTSNEHEWYKKAVQGDEYYRNFFITTKNKPTLIEKFHYDNSVWAKYRDGQKVKDVVIVFPEQAGPVPHWNQGEDGYWYYHTFYPQQPDLNWENPEVFLECAKILIYWAKLGFNFRMDAIPFIGLTGYKEAGQERKKTLMIMACLNYIAKEINPEVTFIVEIFSDLQEMIDFFGNSNIRNSELSYNFHLSTHLWLTQVEQTSKYLWEHMDRLLKLPVHAAWVNFYRNHDELSLAQLTPDEKECLINDLMPNGANFREGNGISGRTFSFLKENVKRHIMAYFLLCSLPGGILIPYGDEIGKKNIPLEKLPGTARIDTRNINRGPLTLKEINSAHGKKIYEAMSEMIQKRSLLRDYMNIHPERIHKIDKNHMFGAMYKSGISKLIVLINLCDQPETIPLDLGDYHTVMSVNNTVVTRDEVRLGPYAGVWLQK